MAPFKWSPSGEGILSELLYGWIGSQGIVAHLLAIFLLLVQGFLINSITIGNRMPKEVNLFPGVFYVLVSSALPDFLYLSPVLIGNTFVLIALNELFTTYKNQACADRIFNTGFWVGVASLFYFPFVFYFIMFNAGLNILRAFNIRERLMALCGLLIPYLIMGMYYFSNASFEVFWETQIVANLSFFSFGSGGSGFYNNLKIILFVMLIVFVLFNNNSYLTKRNIQAQKKISILYWVMISAFISIFFQKNIAFEHLLMLAPACGVFLAFTFTDMKRQWAESIHFLMVLGALALQFIPWQL